MRIATVCTRPRAALSLQERTGSSHFSCKSRCGSIPLFFTVQGGSRRGPTLHECTLLHAVARLALFPAIVNIQVAASSEPRGACRVQLACFHMQRGEVRVQRYFCIWLTSWRA